jgi:hypothetical protein
MGWKHKATVTKTYAVFGGMDFAIRLGVEVQSAPAFGLYL